jgi:hypothetical protein
MRLLIPGGTGVLGRAVRRVAEALAEANRLLALH